MAQEFPDHFSAQAALYASSRPDYPEALYAFLAGLTPAHQLALDCGTGNGQCALRLTEHFDQVIGADGSAEQISHAQAHPRLEYKVATAENTGLQDQSVDLLTAATAVHWFDLPRFFEEARRVLKPGGILATWTYCHTDISPEINVITEGYALETIREFWKPQHTLVFEGYQTIDFPFALQPCPDFHSEKDWNSEQLLNYFMSWSSSQAYLKETGTPPVDQIREKLEAAWGTGSRQVRWPLDILIGKNT